MKEIKEFITWFHHSEFHWTPEGQVLLSQEDSKLFLDFKFRTETLREEIKKNELLVTK